MCVIKRDVGVRRKKREKSFLSSWQRWRVCFCVCGAVHALCGCFLKSVPRELEEAAAIDGAGPFRTMVQIILPLVKSTTVTIGILFFLWTWNDLLLPSIMISDVNLRTITVNLYMFKSSTNAQWNLLIAGLVVSMIPIIIIYIVGQKHITSGLTAGAVK